MLTVVIPAYKPDFLKAALRSLAAQSTKDFQVLVADDCSPHALSSITRDFETALHIAYHRFPTNLGGKSLAAQWTRSVRLSSTAWVWLFSDDDLLDPNCMEVLLPALNGPLAQTTRLFHFNTRIVDHAGELIRETTRYPARLRAREFVQARMDRSYSSFACEYVFSRAAFDEVGGFVDFPAGWCSDDATWVALTGDAEIVTMDSAMVSWRRSEKNISSPNSGLSAKKADAMILYLEWLVQRGITGTPGSGARWFFELLREQGIILGAQRRLQAARVIRNYDGSPPFKCATSLIRHDFLGMARRFKHISKKAFLGKKYD